MEEVIQQIGKAGPESIQDLIDAVMHRYKELYPQWGFVFYSYRLDEPIDHIHEIERLLKRS